MVERYEKDNKMNIYLVYEHFPYEAKTLLGVYGDYEMAEKLKCRKENEKKEESEKLEKEKKYKWADMVAKYYYEIETWKLNSEGEDE